MPDHSEKARDRITEAADTLAEDDGAGREPTSPQEKRSEQIRKTAGDD